MKSINTNDDQDICISIFFNGQFTCSRVVRSRTALSFAAERMVQPFGGRRVDSNLEVPWVILPLTQDETSASENLQENSSFADRWDKVNQLLLQEADQWGRTGKYGMFRSPVGEYLAELAKRDIPETMETRGTVSSKAGIIDVSKCFPAKFYWTLTTQVVVSVGQSTTITNWSNLTGPQRKLPEQVCGKHQQLYVVPEELNSRRKAQIIAQFEREEATRATRAPNPIKNRQSRTQSSSHEHSLNKFTAKTVPLDDLGDKSTLVVSAPDVQHEGEPLSSQALALVMESERLKRGGSVPTLHSSMPQQRPSTKEIARPTTLTGAQTHFTPANTQRAHTPSRKGPPESPWHYLPFDAQKSPSRSTRSTRSKSISASTPDNLLGQELVDSYLTLRNRQLEALASTPLEHPSHSKLLGEVMASSPGISSQTESSPFRPSTRPDLHYKSSSRLHKNGDVSGVTGLGLHGAGNAQKRTSDASMSAPARSSKRKWPSSLSPNTTLDDSEISSKECPEDANRTKRVSKDDAASDHSAPKFKRSPQNPLNTGETDSQMQDLPGLREMAEVGQPEEPTKKKQRNRSRAMSTRELNSLLTPHKLAMGVNTSFGASFATASSTRPTRNPPTRQNKIASETEVETLQSDPPHVTAAYQTPMLIIDGVQNLKLESITQNPVKNSSRGLRNAASEPPPNINDNEQATRANISERFSKTNKPEKRVSATFKAFQDGQRALMISVEPAIESAKTLGLKTARFDMKGRKVRLEIDKNAVNEAFHPRTKPEGTIKPLVARETRPPLLSQQEMNTPAPNSVTFTTPKHIGTPDAMTHAISSSATLINTSAAASAMSSRPTPDSRMPRSASRPHSFTTTQTIGSSNSSPVESRLSNPSELADLAWKPNFLCADSVLSYATENAMEGWEGDEYASQSGSAYRGTKQEREAVFRANGILMGVRFVVGG